MRGDQSDVREHFEWGAGGRGRGVGLIGMTLTCQLSSGATKLLAKEGKKVHDGLLLEEGRCGLLRERGVVGGREGGRQRTRWISCKYDKARK